jgi:hypothetical protein
MDIMNAKTKTNTIGMKIITVTPETFITILVCKLKNLENYQNHFKD